MTEQKTVKERLKIGVTCYPSLGGSGVVATELGKSLAEKGHEVHFITHSMPFRLGKYEQNIYYHEAMISDYYVFKYPPYDLSLASKMAQVATMQQLDLLHVHYALPHAICAFLAKQMVGDHLKVVTTLHGTDITILAQEEASKGLISLAINESDAVTAVSDHLVSETRTRLGIDRPIDRIYNFIDQKRYYPRNCTETRLRFAQPNEKIVMHISNFRPVKRAMDVVEIFSKIHEQLPAKLLLVGEGPELSKVHQEIHQRGLEGQVHFLGKQDDVAQMLSIADVMLLPSEKESFGLVALEAMACGVPTIASNAGGIPELITHGETGWLAPVGDTDQMAAYALQLLQDDALQEAFSAKGIKRATTQFIDKLIVEQYESVYRRVLGESD